MTQTISLSRLARLVGVPRARLQRMAQSGELQTFDGEVELAEVMRAFPDAAFENDSEIRRVEAIKDAAVAKSAERADLPDAAVLKSRLEQLSADYANVLGRLRHYETVHGWLEARLEELIRHGKLDHASGRQLLADAADGLAAVAGDIARWQKLVSRERFMRVMSAQVTVRPRNVVFETQGNETLLEAGLRAGLSLSYACSNGNCGECKARVVDGAVTKVKPHDYALSQSEKASGMTLMCCYAATGDATIETTLAGAHDIPEQSIEARIRAIEPLGDAIIALHLLTPRSERLRFLAGQRLRIEIGDERAELPIASCPCEERRIELHLPRASAVGRHVATLSKANDPVTIVGPFGDFVLDETSTRPLVLIAEGYGFAPVKSLVQHALSLDNAPSISLHWLAGSAGLYQESLPRSYASALDNFTYRAMSAGSDPAAFAAQIAALPDIASADVYAAGSAPFLSIARTQLAAGGVPAERWHEQAVAKG